MRIIAGDIGGTKTLLRCVEEDGTTSAERRFESGAYSTFDQLLGEFLQFCSTPVDAACFAVAGPVLGEKATVTNVGWTLEAAALQEAHQIARVALINDFYAIALGVPVLPESDLFPLQVAERDRNAPLAILGAGTGLGQAYVHNVKNEWHVISSEGGHGDFAPQDEEQTKLLLHLLKEHDHVSWERVCSGMGLENIHTFLGGSPADPAEIAQRAESGDATALRTIGMFVDIYGAEAGNMGLSVLARGGVYLAGGIAAKNVQWFTDGRFVAAFRRKGRFAALMATIPVFLISNEQVGLLGAVEGARRVAAGER
ncbi:MAG TPA: glucokinase [Thermoanaerobaculia bacterium]|jgi:glucokinase